jgi:hypothetical protein
MTEYDVLSTIGTVVILIDIVLLVFLAVRAIIDKRKAKA